MKAQVGSGGIVLLIVLTSVLYGGGWLTPRPGRFTPWKETRYLLYRRLGGPQGRSGRVQKISPLPGFDRWTVQPIVSRYTCLDYTTPPPYTHRSSAELYHYSLFVPSWPVLGRTVFSFFYLCPRICYYGFTLIFLYNFYLKQYSF